MTLILFTQNILEDAAITVQPPADTARPVARTYDRDKSLQYRSVGQAWQLNDTFPLCLSMVTKLNVTLDAVFTSAREASAFAMLNHNIQSTGLLVYKSSDGIVFTEVARIPVTGIDPVYFEFSSTGHSKERWRIQFQSSATSTEAMQIGELMLGVPRRLGNPSMTRTKEAILGNVRRDESIGGFSHKVRVGIPRVRLAYGWDTMPTSDWVELQAAYADILEGTKNLLTRLPDDITLRWVEVQDAILDSDPFTNTLRRVGLLLVEAL